MGKGFWLILLCSVGAGAQEAKPVDPPAQEMHVPKVVPVPQPKPAPPPPKVLEPTDPPAQDFFDRQQRLAFHLEPGWNLSRNDGELSTFHQDARTAPRSAQLRAAAMLAFNPFPRSTFSGAMLSYSVVPGLTAKACHDETRTGPDHALNALPVGGMSFWRGLDEHGKVCTESRNVTYTAWRRGSCLRFDLTVNTFCGGDVSGVADMTDVELAGVFRRLERILDTVEFRDAAGKKLLKP